MALGLGNNNTTFTTGTTSPATHGGLVKPVVGDLVVFTVETNPVVTFGSPTDNSSGGGAWNVFPGGPLVNATFQTIGCWYKIANAQDHANLTTVSVTITTSTFWDAGVTSFTGFTNIPTLDVQATVPLTGGAVTTVTAAGSPAQGSASEVVVGVIGIGSTFTGASTFYSPDGGTTKYLLTKANANSSDAAVFFAFPTTLGPTPEWVWTWNTAAQAMAMAASFSDGVPAPANQGNMLLVMGA